MTHLRSTNYEMAGSFMITLDPNGGAVFGVTTVSTVKVGSGVTISSDGDVFTTGITTSSTVIVGSGVTISESGIEHQVLELLVQISTEHKLVEEEI